MKIISTLVILICAAFTFAAGWAGKPPVTAENELLINSGAADRGAAAQSISLNPVGQPTPARKIRSPNEPPPEKIDRETAYSPIYGIRSKNCQNKDGQGSEGEDILRKCQGYGNYSLWASGFDYRINYRIESNNPKSSFSVSLFPLEDGEAAKYARADLYDEKLADKIEWQLDEKGKPYAIIIRAAFYKNIGSAKTFANPKNKVAEFVLVRGLAGNENLKVDLPTVNTAYNPDEQARMVASQYLEKHRQ